LRLPEEKMDKSTTETLDECTLDRAARAAYDASCAVHGTATNDRDFKVQIMEWRAIAAAVEAATRTLAPSFVPSIDRTLGIPEGSDPKMRTNATIDAMTHLDVVVGTLKRISDSGGSNGTSGDGHQAAIQASDRTLSLIAIGPMKDRLGLDRWSAR
jgi:hypothetical protein